MRKFTTSFLGVLLLMLSCNKQEAPLPEETQVNSDLPLMRSCASEEILQTQIAQDPERGRRLAELERITELYKNRDFRDGREAGKLYIPVVVHVVHQDENIVSDAQIQSQIDVLNADFNKTNVELNNKNIYLADYPYANVANCELEFYVKQVVRKKTSVASFSNDAVKRTVQGGSDAVNPENMLNMWVCNLGGGLLGYAQFPGGNTLTDGVVIDYQGFGTTAKDYALYKEYGKGRTATHEIGHWLNLRHIWGDRTCGTDGVDDTPQHDSYNGGCPKQGLKSTCTGEPLEQWMNYMDYTYDACMYMFTSGQKQRMDIAIDQSRSAYVNKTKI